MKKFHYTAIKDKREVVSGYIEANSPEEAKQKVYVLGFLPTKIREEDLLASPHNDVPRGQAVVSRIKLGDKIQFTSEFQTLIQAGISPVEALDTLQRHAPGKTLSRFAKDLCEKIKRGQSFSTAMNDYEKQFGRTYLSLVETGESSGTLPQTLKYLTELLRKQDDLKGKYIQMSIYPALLILALIGIFFLFGGYVFPKFIQVCNINPSDIPPSASALIDGVKFTLNYWWMILLSAGVGVYGLKLVGELSTLKDSLSRTALNIPKLGECLQYLSLSHYMTVLRVSYDAGVPITAALGLAENSIGNAVLREKANAVSRLVQNGEELADAFMHSGLLPPIFMSLIATGEKTGQLGKMFRDIAIAVEQKLEMAIKVLSSLFEPALLLIIGIAVAYLVVCFFQMYSSAFGSLM